MKNLSPLFILLVLFFNSCSKEKFDPLGENGNPTSYVLKSITQSGLPVPGDIYLFFYNDDHLISEIMCCRATGYVSNDSSAGVFRDTTYFRFKYLNERYVKCEVHSRFDIYYWIYEYDNNHNVKKQIFYDKNNVERSEKSFKYDDRNNLIEVISLQNKTPLTMYVMTYNNENNLNSSTYYDLSTPLKKRKREYLSFDTHVNFARTINGSPMIFSGEYIIPGYSGSSPNNYIDSKFYSSVEINQPFDEINYTSVSIQEYNDEGLPLIQKSGDLITTYEYEKYK